MAGLLDNINNPWMSLGAGLLRAAGPHLDPSKATLGAGLSSGLNAISEQQQLQFRQALLKQQQQQMEAKNQREMQKYQQAQSEAVRLKEARQRFQLLLSQGDLKGAATQATLLGEGAVANKLLDAVPGQSQFRFDGKSIPGQQMNAVMDGLMGKWRADNPNMSAEQEEAVRKKLFYEMSVRGLMAPKQTGVTPSGLPIITKPQDLPTIPGVPSGGAQGATVGSGQGTSTPFFAPTSETQRVQPQLPAGTTAAQVAAAPGLTDGGAGGASPRDLAPDEQPEVLWNAGAEQGRTIVNEETGEADPERNDMAARGAAKFRQADLTGEQILARKEPSERLSPVEVAAINLPVGSEVVVAQDPVSKRKHFKVIYKGKELTENERKQLMQLTLATRAMSQVRSLIDDVDPGAYDLFLRKFASQSSAGSVATRFLMEKAFDTEPGLNPKEAELAARTESVSNILLALYRGAQVGPAEQIRFDKQLPVIGQHRSLFMANLDQQDRNLTEAIKLFEKMSGKSFSKEELSQLGPKMEAVREPSGAPPANGGSSTVIDLSL